MSFSNIKEGRNELVENVGKEYLRIMSKLNTLESKLSDLSNAVEDLEKDVLLFTSINKCNEKG